MDAFDKRRQDAAGRASRNELAAALDSPAMCRPDLMGEVGGPSAPPARVTCWVGEGISFEASVERVFSSGVFIRTNSTDLNYSDGVRIELHTDTSYRVRFDGTVSTWVRNRGARIEASPDTDKAVFAALAAWAEGMTVDVEGNPAITQTKLRRRVGPESALEGRSVLAIDDDPIILRMLRRRLSRFGCDVVVTESPQEALRIVENQEVDAVLLDWLLPEIPGQELLQRIRKNHEDLPIAVLSGAAWWQDVEARIRDLGVSEVLHKPVDIDRILGWLCKVTNPPAYAVV